MKKAALILALVFLLGIGLIWVIQDREPATKEEALTQAAEFVCEQAAAAVVTPAVHTKTGAEYEFGSSCLPTGWEAKIPN